MNKDNNSITGKSAKQRILDGFFWLDMSEEFNAFVREWLTEETTTQEKKDALLDALDNRYPSEITASTETLASLNTLKEKMGISITQYRIKDGRVLIPEFKAKKNNLTENVIKLKKRPLWMKISAVLIPLLIIGAASLFIIQQAPYTNRPTYRTIAVSTEGKQQHLTLPDGSKITVKSGTVQYGGDFKADRRVTISGEAYFHVVKDETHPFTVDAGGMTVTVLGTEFNVRAIESEATSEVMLARGKVSVDADGIPETTVMAPGQTYVYDKIQRSMELSELSRVELMQMLGKTLQFRSETVRNILDSIGDYYGVIMHVDKSLRLDNDVRVDFTGEEPLDDVLYTLQAATDKFDYHIIGDTVHVTPKGRK